MKRLRKWSRILHRDIGFFFMGTTLVYAISGIALNHRSDWNPNYSVTLEEVQTDIDLSKSNDSKTAVMLFLKELGQEKDYRKHYYPSPTNIKIFLKGGSSVIIDTKSGKGQAEYLKKRPLFYQINYLHYNPNNWWKWFSDIFASTLIILVISAMFMIKGKKGFLGRGGIYAILGLLFPIIFLIIFQL